MSDSRVSAILGGLGLTLDDLYALVLNNPLGVTLACFQHPKLASISRRRISDNNQPRLFPARAFHLDQHVTNLCTLHSFMLFYSETSTPEIIAGHSYGGLAAATREVVCSSTSTTRLSLLVSLNARYRALSTQATANMTLLDRLMLACSCRGDLARSSHAHNSIAIVNAPTSVVTCCQLSVTSLIICEAQAEGVLGGASERGGRSRRAPLSLRSPSMEGRVRRNGATGSSGP